MLYVTIKNTASRTSRYFAESFDRALDIAIEVGHARKRTNLRVVAHQEVCEYCYIHEGLASLRVSPEPRVHQAWTKEHGRREQDDRGTLHDADECRYSK